MDSSTSKYGIQVLFTVYILCLAIHGAFGSCTSQSPSCSGSEAGVWREPNDFKAWLQYVHQTSDPSANRSTGTPIYSANKTPGVQSNMNEQTNSTEKNILQIQRRIVVDQSGKGDCRTIQEAVDRVPSKNNERVLIRIRPGVYREKVRIPSHKPYITFQGYGNKTIITFNSTAGDPDPMKRHGILKTFNSATVAVNSKFFMALNIVFENSAPTAPPGSEGKQAVAFRISGDMAAFYNCVFLGTQDTLYDHHGRHYFKNCYMQGTVDFVFGNGRSLYKNCVLNALDNSGVAGSLTAQKRNGSTLDTGFAFVDSYISGSGQVYLGRAWGSDSRVVFARCYMDDVILPVGWNNWGLEGRERTSYYAEYDCSGPGAATSGRAPWARVISPGEAKPFLSSAFINGRMWLPRGKREVMD